MAGIKVISPSIIEPVSVTDVKIQLRYDESDTSPDVILEPLITAAREWCEAYQKRVYITQTLELSLDEWPVSCEIEIPRPPLRSVTQLTYVASDGATKVWDSSNYLVDDYSFVARIVKKSGVPWPQGQLAAVNGIRVLFAAGYGDNPIDVPQKIRYAITLLTMHWFENGMCDAPDAVKSLLMQDRLVML